MRRWWHQRTLLTLCLRHGLRRLRAASLLAAAANATATSVSSGSSAGPSAIATSVSSAIATAVRCPSNGNLEGIELQ